MYMLAKTVAWDDKLLWPYQISNWITLFHDQKKLTAMNLSPNTKIGEHDFAQITNKWVM